MLTGEIRSQIDTIWNAFWSGGISNPLEVIEQIIREGVRVQAGRQGDAMVRADSARIRIW